MYCKSCGKTLPAGATKCPNCGKSTDSMTGGNGFWDMVTGPKSTAPVSPVTPAGNAGFSKAAPQATAKPAAQTNAPAPEGGKSSGGILTIVSLAVAVIALVAAILAFTKIGGLETAVNTLNREIQTLEEALEAQPTTPVVTDPVITTTPPTTQILTTEPVVTTESQPDETVPVTEPGVEVAVEYSDVTLSNGKTSSAMVFSLSGLEGDCSYTWYIVTDSSLTDPSQDRQQDTYIYPNPLSANADRLIFPIDRAKGLDTQQNFLDDSGNLKRFYCVVECEGETITTDFINPLDYLLEEAVDESLAGVTILEEVLEAIEEDLGPISYRWEYSADGITWQSVQENAENSLTASQIDPAYAYRFVVLDQEGNLLAQTIYYQTQED